MEKKIHSLINQYKKDSEMKVKHSNLKEQFSHLKTEIFNKIEKLVDEGDYTLGSSVIEFEENMKNLLGVKYVVGLNSGTDALFLGLKSLGIGMGDEVITTPYTFFATIASIRNTGAKPVFVDIGLDLNIDTNLLEKSITSKTKAILPVHWAGLPANMEEINKIAKNKNLYVIEDACQSINSEIKGRKTGTFGDIGCFSMHPLKNLNVWGDGGFISTNSEELYNKLILLRNHGLSGRNESIIYGYNSRLDSIQAIVANIKLKEIEEITNKRIKNAEFYDSALNNISELNIQKRYKEYKHVFHLYIVRVNKRDSLLRFLNNEKKIDAKIHYPIPMHLQEAAKDLGYKKGDFPLSEKVCSEIISLPINESLSEDQLNYVVDSIKEFYSKSGYGRD